MTQDGAGSAAPLGTLAPPRAGGRDASRHQHRSEAPMLSKRTRPWPDAEPSPHASHVADLLHVAPKTIARWAKDGRLPSQRTLGGHRRDPEQAIRQLAASLAQEVRAS